MREKGDELLLFLMYTFGDNFLWVKLGDFTQEIAEKCQRLKGNL